MDMKRFFLYAIVIAALTLAGCGGGGGGGNNSRIMELEDMLSTVTDERNTAQARVTELEGMLSDANDMIESLNMQIANAPTQAMVDELTQMRDNYKTMADNYKTMLDAANAELAQLKEDAADDLAAAAKADRTAREMRVRTSIVANRIDDATGAANTATQRFPGTASGVNARNVDETSADSEAEFGVTRAVDGTITIDVNGTDNDDMYTGGENPAGSGNWNGAVLTKSNDDTAQSTDTLVIYTDIDAPSDRMFTDKYAQTVLDDILNVSGQTNVQRARLAMSDGFPSDPGTTWDYDGSQGGRSKTVTGTYDGVPGQFTCTATATCSLSTDANGRLNASASGQTWRFTPNSPNTATVKEPDTGYAWFGWWLNKPKDNKAAHTVEVFAGGNNPANIPVVLEGTARYSGEAAGKYTTRTFTAGVQTDAGVGHFTADANLTARFGNETAPGTITGNITNFLLDDSNSVAWRVALESADLTADTATFGGWTEADFGGGLSDTEATGTPSDTDPDGIGRWQGSFYGPGAATVAADKRYPDAVAGTFDALTADNNATVTGGFGATRQ